MRKSRSASRRIDLFLQAAAVVISLILAAAGCETTAGSDFNILSTQEEISLGEKFATEVEEQETLLDDPVVRASVARVCARLASVAPRQNVQYTAKVIDAPDTVNAFALPGGFLYIYTGLLKICENEAELAGVMAHEIAHVAAYHHGETLTRMVGLQVMATMVLGKDPSQTARLVADLFLSGVAARYSREQERQADSLGMEILFRAGYRPDAMISFMHKLMEYNRGRVYLPIFSSHPPTEERILLLQQLVQKYPPDLRSANPLYVDRYRQEVLTRLN